MFGITGFLGRVIGGLLYGFLTFGVLFIVGLLVAHHVDTQVGVFIEGGSVLIGILVGLYVFITGSKPS